MLSLDVSFPPTLADLSRNASVISTSSSSESLPSPRPVRNFSSPRTQSPNAPSPRALKPPPHLTRELGLPHAAARRDTHQPHLPLSPADSVTTMAPARLKSRNTSANGRLTAQDFDFGATIGEGSYSTVMRATHIASGQEYAIKVLDKGHLIRHQKMSTALAEKNALVRLGAGHPGIVRLSWTFHDEWSLYFVLDLARNGEMQTRISQLGSLSTECTRYYAAQIVDAVDFMHFKGVIHRDLKPENLLLDDAYRIRITDFGTGKILDSDTDRAKTFVGTAQYLSPELLEATETSKSSDLWAIGCIIYQMIAGRFAFHGLSEYLTWQKIKQLEYSFPDGFDEQAKDLVEKFLVRDPAKRLGAGPPNSDNDMKALRAHPFFSSIDWNTLWTDPAPPLEAGLVKKERPVTKDGTGQNWADMGAVWDELVGCEMRDTDEIAWASDGEGPRYELVNKRNGHASNKFMREEGPMGEVPRYNNTQDRFTFPMKDVKDLGDDQDWEGRSGPPKVLVTASGRSRRSSAGSGSSEEGSPIERVGAVVLEKRGRDRSLTPIQGNNPPDGVWSSLLLPGETVVFESAVEPRTLRRRASMLFPIHVQPVKVKTWLLILTTQRLLCLKLQPKGSAATVKSEFALRCAPSKGRCVVTGVESKGEQEFVIITSLKSHPYSAQSSSVASTWIQKINEAVKQPLPQPA